MHADTFAAAGLLAACLFFAATPGARAAEPLTVRTAQYELRLNGDTGDLESFAANGRELILACGAPRALFTLRFRAADGAPTDLSALSARAFSAAREETDGETRLVLAYTELDGRPVDVRVTVRCPHNEPTTYWSLSLTNGTGLRLDHIDFPTVVTPDDLVATGGDARVFWPGMEGVVVEDLSLREGFWWKWRPIEHPTMGWIGLYPSSCPMQFMAYYGRDAGLYLAAHDPESHPKGVEYHPHPQGGIFLDYRLFPGGVIAREYAMPYEMALGAFTGDWHDAAERYRAWLETSAMPRPPRLAENPALPDWFQESPIVVTYPVRGTKDLGDMAPNEYFPHTKALPALESLSKQFDSKVLALLMHWEGSAPWSPPYVWPPYGGTEDFSKFVEALHAAGNLAGLYASGTGYTIRSNTDPSFTKEEEFEDLHLVDIVARAPDGTPAENGVCAGPNAQRIGYDMCPANEWVKDTVAREVAKILPSGVDYLQYFDQNLGGACYRCYATTHGHAPGPGLWQNAAMADIYRRIQELVARSGRRVLIGCEAAAAEPFIPYLLFNDNRFHLNLHAGTPVPAYAYVHHEHLNSFMGNQNGVSAFVDIPRSPLNLHQRVALSFVQGDFLTAVLKGGGKLCWEWGGSWDAEGPDHDSVAALMRNLNAWRRGAGKPYLLYGRMLKPFPVAGDYEIPIITPRDQRIPFRSVFTTRWQAGGKTAQVLVNYTPEPQRVTLLCGEAAGRAVLFTGPRSAGIAASTAGADGLALELSPLNAVLVEWGE